ncbi:tellurite resistance TerB family protein [Tistrella mobilis]|uniref:tellurite resistance TerB family protein n=1 Tax=Tistrella mobilis TaxID=171437 RepID=UPI003555FBB7
MDARKLLDQVMGAASSRSAQGGRLPSGHSSRGHSSGGLPSGLGDMLGKVTGGARGGGGAGGLGSMMGGFGGGAVTGGLVGLLFGNKKARKTMKKFGGGALGYGGAAMLGALAYRAWADWRSGKAPEAAVPARPDDAAAAEPAFRPLDTITDPAEAEGFAMAVLKAMIGAAKADGHIDADERGRIFAEVERRDFDPETKAAIFQVLDAPVSIPDIVAAGTDEARAAEIWLAARLAVDVDHPAERVWLDALAHGLKLPAPLVEHLDRQAVIGLNDPGQEMDPARN